MTGHVVEFLYVDDLADALVFLIEHYSDDLPVNGGCGLDIPIRDLAALIGKVVGFEGEFIFNRKMPDGTPRKFLDISLLTELGWQNARSFDDALHLTYDAFVRETDERS